jgi:hypothetical protein
VARYSTTLKAVRPLAQSSPSRQTFKTGEVWQPQAG